MHTSTQRDATTDPSSSFHPAGSAFVADEDRPAGHATHSAPNELFTSLSAPNIAAGQATQAVAPGCDW